MPSYDMPEFTVEVYNDAHAKYKENSKKVQRWCWLNLAIFVVLFIVLAVLLWQEASDKWKIMYWAGLIFTVVGFGATWSCSNKAEKCAILETYQNENHKRLCSMISN